MNYSDRITRALFGLSARDRHDSYLRFIAVCDDDGTDDLGFSGDELAMLRHILPIPHWQVRHD